MAASGLGGLHLSIREEMTKPQLFRVSLGFLGLMFAAAMKNVYTTPIFKDKYGVSTSDLGYVWLAGPLSGLIVQPSVGVLSDALGERRYFLGGGCLLMALAMVWLPNCNAVALAFGAESGGSVALGLAIAALWILDLAMNAGIVALRGVIADAAPPMQQPQANEALVIAYGLGMLLGYTVGSLDLASFFGLASTLDNDTLLFLIAAITLIATGLVSFFEASRLEKSAAAAAAALAEPPIPTDTGTTVLSPRAAAAVAAAAAAAENGGKKRTWGNAWEIVAFWNVPKWLAPVCALLVFSWVGWFAVTIYGSDWIGTVVFGGDADASESSTAYQDYEDGVEWASIGLAVQSIVVMAMGVGPVAFIWRRVGLRGSFLLALAVQGGALLVTLAVQEGAAGKAASLVLLALLGVPLALIETVPYLLVGICGARRKNGELLGKLNVYICLAEFLLAVCVEPLTSVFGAQDETVIAVGGAVALCGVICLPWLQEVERKGLDGWLPLGSSPESGEGGRAVSAADAGHVNGRLTSTLSPRRDALHL